MSKMIPKYDFLVVGGGIFGVYAAIYLAQKGWNVCLLEKEKVLFSKASVVNQARLHGGYHYPRSVATALMSNDNKERFTREHKDFINFEFEKYYAVDRFSSFTNAAQFQRFCEFISITCEEVPYHPLIKFDRIEALFKTTEYSFDPILIAHYYWQRLKEQKYIQLHTQVAIKKANPIGDYWEIEYQDLPTGKTKTVHASQVINATYAGSNTINQLFNCAPIDLMHEIAEIVLLSSPKLQQFGLTIMDGPFGSIMPYGKSGLLSLSSVAYTHHKVSYQKTPVFDCQAKVANCSPDFLSICNTCPAQPSTHYDKMLSQIKLYFREEVPFHYFRSLFTIKSKLMANYIDDGRPTEIALLNENPRFYCIFAGKINSIYEIEKIIS